MSTLGRRLLGLAFIAVLLGGVALSVAMYNKAFSEFVTVKLYADKVGNQLAEQSDVKVRGLIVGTVHEVAPTPTGSELTLRLDPASAKLIPENVSARFLPKTLFGERYVALRIPEDPAERSLSDGDVIPQDRSSAAVELSQAFEHLLPVLQAVQPQKLSSTLTAISTSLQGRGEPLGETLSELGGYLGELNPHVPALQENLRQLATFSDTLSEVAPDLVQTLDNLRTTSRTIVDQRQSLQILYSDLTFAADDLRGFLEANSENIIALGKSLRPTGEVLAKYAPELPCVLGQMAELVPKLDIVFGKGTDNPGLHATLEITNHRGPYQPGRDEPEFNDKRGPRCYAMDAYPVPFPQHPPEGPIKDGSEHPPPARSVNDGLNPPQNAEKVMGGGGAPVNPMAGNPANTPAEHALLSELLGMQLGMAPSDVPGWSGLLVGPLYRGAEVNVR
ncbi:virulence factor Mce family protein [Amycolatopsis arida]|uniref:Virulence factor Mce family protein n=1 Tax=Amycolatopsis arida TaxID=587909 RepID=A0A1I6A435_9PSEU|nr:MCE family protein [Amycolatopsis arida]TDX88625.1 virulence factor Mce-like protein [Amycolatopsis arida]SFQ63506.1 virulence factor Mce family protein [Amycolatopsis arida]